MVDLVNNTVSYTTTHFSKYLLVDKLLWFNTWNEDIDYPEDEPTELTYQPTQLFVIKDSVSGNAEVVDLVDEIQNTLKETSNVFNWYTEADIIMQSGRCQHWEPGSYYSPAFREYYTDLGYLITDGDGMDYIYSGFDGINLDSTLNSIIYTCDKYPDHFSYYNTAIILISGRSSGASDEVLQACADRGLKIYTVDIKNDTVDSSLQKLSSSTNGNHYYGEITQNPTLLVNSLAYVMNGFTSYGSDRDTDGLLDKYEENGVRTIVGRLITTDPDKDDTDGDNLSDYEELGMVYDLNLYIGFGITKNCRFVIPYSDPTMKDTDGDGKMDNEDPHPFMKEKVDVQINNIYDIYGVEYLSIDGLNGGNQGWWPDEYGDYPETIDGYKEGYYNYVVNLDYRISHFGCGLIAMTDLELYLAQQKGYYNIPYRDKPYPDGGYIIDKDEYMRLVEYNRDNVYLLSDYVYNFVIGVTPMDMVQGIKRFLVYNGEDNAYAEWGGVTDRREAIHLIEHMISENIPIVFSYYDGVEKLNLYYQYEYAVDKLNDDAHRWTTDSHYMTIIGYSKFFEEGSNSYRYILKVVSWGDIYFVDLDEYVDHLNIFTNLLEVDK